MKVKIKRFDPSTMRRAAVVMMIGKRGTGKSTLMKDIMYNMRKELDFGIAMSPTEESTSDMSSYIPKSCIYNDFCGPAVDVMLAIQRKTVKTGKYKNVYLIMDDCLYDKTVLKGKNMREIFMNGRHRKVFFMAAIQYLMDIGPDLRTQVDYVFALRENIISNREKLWKFFFGMFEDYKDFAVVMNQCTAGHDCLVLDNTVKSTRVEDCVYWYRADPDIPEFQMGAPGIWDLDAKHYTDREERRKDDAKTALNVTTAIKHVTPKGMTPSKLGMLAEIAGIPGLQLGVKSHIREVQQLDERGHALPQPSTHDHHHYHSSSSRRH